MLSSPGGEVGKTVTIWNGTLAKSIMRLVSFLFRQPSHGILISIMCLHFLKTGRGRELQYLDITTGESSEVPTQQNLKRYLVLRSYKN